MYEMNIVHDDVHAMPYKVWAWVEKKLTKKITYIFAFQTPCYFKIRSWKQNRYDELTCYHQQKQKPW